MSYRGPLASAVAVCVLILTGAFALWACAPTFPPWLLTDEAGILEAPMLWLRDALQPLLPPGKPAFPAAVDQEGPIQQTAKADRKDLEAALAGLPPERRQDVIGPYMKVRDAIVAYRTGGESAQYPQLYPTPIPPPPPDSSMVPPGLPGEFEDYLRGAIAWHQGKPDAARAAWEKLLARPAGERRRRSTWAAFMLGKAALESDPAAAIHWLERTRELAAQGFADPLGLAAASLGWQARAEVNRRRFDEALKLYLRQHQAGDPTALGSIREVAGKMLDDPKALQQVARSPEARPIFTAWVLSLHYRADSDEEEPSAAKHPDWGELPDYYFDQVYSAPPDPVPARKWLAAIRGAGIGQTDGADRLAWVAYRAGDFSAAEEWLRRAPAQAPMARWIRAKLLLRAGKIAAAEPLLAQARAALPPSPTPVYDLWMAYVCQLQPALRPRAAGELGAARLVRGEYAAALDDLLRGGWWSDAAYVAERVLTLDELRAYVDKTWGPSLAAHYNPDAHNFEAPSTTWEIQLAGLAPPPDARIAHDIRYLLGRRLVRERKVAEARAYLPAKHQAALDDLARSLAAGQDASRSDSERSQALFRAACLTRYQGMELLGTELEPDWFLYDGEYAPYPFVAARNDPKRHRRLGPTADERRRVLSHHAEPERRFHYRYRGMDLALEAAKLLPPGEERARLLATAGNWVEPLDPRGARPLYDAIQSCCANNEIARRSRQVKAITNVPDACPADTRVVQKKE